MVRHRAPPLSLPHFDWSRLGGLGLVGWTMFAPVTAIGQQHAPPSASQAQAASQRDTAATAAASVISLAGNTVYVNAGRADGLVEGSEMSVIRHDSVAATLRVTYLASHQAACEIIRGAADVLIGELVRYSPQLTPAASGATGAAATRRYGSRRLSGPGLHGRIGGRYLRAQENPTNTGFEQPSMDLRLDGLALGGTPVGLAVDLRTRRTTTSTATGGSQVDGHTRVYQAVLLWNAPGARYRVAVGRQYLTAVTSVSLFDGGLVELSRSFWTVGGFAGLEPEPANLGFSTDIQDFGGYFQLHNQPGKPTRWSLTTGIVESYRAGVANREFGFAQASISSSHLSVYALQEVDYYRPWKVQIGESSITPTSTYLSGSLRPLRWLALNGSYDDRRRARLYRDAVDPATAFDDSYRRGVSGGFALLGSRVRVSGDVHRSTGGTAAQATSYTGGVGVDRLTRLSLSVSTRGTWYGSGSINGQLYTARVGFDPFGSLHLDVNGGFRSEDDPVVASNRRRFTWFGLDADLNLARAWFLSLSAERESAPDATTTQLYGSLSWRF